MEIFETAASTLESAESQSVLYRRTKRGTALNSMCGVLDAKEFKGQIQNQERSASFIFSPRSATIENHQFVLSGQFSLSTSPAGSPATTSVKASLIGAQGGVGSAPLRRQLEGATTQGNQTTDEDNGPGTELQPGLHAFESPRMDKDGRPVVESSGDLGFTGALFFRLSPLDSIAQALKMDLSHVQLNARLNPNDELGREFLYLLTDVTTAVLGKTFDEPAATKASSAVNEFLKT